MRNDTYIIDLINILSFLIGVENLELNDTQIKQLEEHLNNQDKQYERIIELLEGETNGRKRKKDA